MYSPAGQEIEVLEGGRAPLGYVLIRPNFRNGGRGGAEGLESAKLVWRTLSFWLKDRL